VCFLQALLALTSRVRRTRGMCFSVVLVWVALRSRAFSLCSVSFCEKCNVHYAFVLNSILNLILDDKLFAEVE